MPDFEEAFSLELNQQAASKHISAFSTPSKAMDSRTDSRSVSLKSKKFMVPEDILFLRTPNGLSHIPNE